MKYKDFTVVTRFIESKGANVNRLTGGAFLIDNAKFGEILFDKKIYTIGNVYVKAPSEHKVEG
jgi:carbonic anhydrase